MYGKPFRFLCLQNKNPMLSCPEVSLILGSLKKTSLKLYPLVKGRLATVVHNILSNREFIVRVGPTLSEAHNQWLVGCFGLNGPLRQYFNLYRSVSLREGERREMIDESKMSKQPPPTSTINAVGPCPIIIQISRTPRHWKFTQHHRTTQPYLTQSRTMCSSR